MEFILDIVGTFEVFDKIKKCLKKAKKSIDNEKSQ